MPARRTLGRLFLAAGILATVALAALALRGVDWSGSWRALRHSEPIWIVPSLLLLAAGMATKAVRWRFLFLPATRPSNGAVLRATFLGYLYLSVMPARTGELPRILVLHRLSGTSKVEIAGTAVVERVFDLAALLTFFFVLAPWAPAGSWVGPLAWLAGALGLVIVAVVVLLQTTGERGLALVLRPVGLLPRVGREKAESAATTLRQGLAGLHDRTTALLALGLTAASWLLFAASCTVAMRAFHLHVSPLAGMLVVIAVSLAASLPSLPAGIGIFEAATIKALGAYGVSRENGLAFALAWHALNVVPFLLFALPFVLALRRRPVTPD